MKRIAHFEVPHLALWMSTVAEVLSRERKQPASAAAGIDSDHPILRATDRYCQAMEANAPLPAPPVDSNDQEAVLTYLSYLHHKRAHARIANNAEVEAAIEKQTAEYKFGNPMWQLMYMEYFKYYWQYPFHKGGAPKYRSWQAEDGGKGNLQYGVVEWRLPAQCRVVIVGDIGTGTDEAAAVLVAALKFKPDAILHLGDVYFSGTTFEMKHRLVELVRDVMKSEHKRVPFFTVPGNHEYFTGAIPYLHTLESNELIVEASQMQKASYFCLRTADDGWQFLGLDTGYHGHYMNVPASAQQAVLERLHIGAIETAHGTDPHWPSDRNPFFRKASGANLPVGDTTKNVDQVTVRSDELQWHKNKLNTFLGTSILLSHHQLYSALDACGVAQTTTAGPNGTAISDPTDFNRIWIDTGLWRQFGPFFGSKVAAWIWGHEHNLGIFEDAYRPADWPADTDEAKQVFRTLPLGRCAGHSAIPVQESEAPYAQKYSVNLQRPDVKLGLTNGWYNHGFELLDIHGKERPAQLRYYQVAEADPTPFLIFSEQVEPSLYANAFE